MTSLPAGCECHPCMTEQRVYGGDSFTTEFRRHRFWVPGGGRPPGNASFTRQRIQQAVPIGFGVGRPAGIGG